MQSAAEFAQEQLDQALIKATSEGDVQAMQEALNRGGDVNAQSGEPLRAAVRAVIRHRFADNPKTVKVGDREKIIGNHKKALYFLLQDTRLRINDRDAENHTVLYGAMLSRGQAQITLYQICGWTHNVCGLTLSDAPQIAVEIIKKIVNERGVLIKELKRRGATE